MQTLIISFSFFCNFNLILFLFANISALLNGVLAKVPLPTYFLSNSSTSKLNGLDSIVGIGAYSFFLYFNSSTSTVL